MRRKGILSAVVALVMMFSMVSSVFAVSSTVLIPNLDYFVQHSLKNDDTVTFKYKNTSSTTQTAIFRITNVGPLDTGTGQVTGKFQGSHSLVYANGQTINLGTIGGSSLSGGLNNYLAPNASLVVTVKNANANSQNAFKIRFDNH